MLLLIKYQDNNAYVEVLAVTLGIVWGATILGASQFSICKDYSCP